LYYEDSNDRVPGYVLLNPLVTVSDACDPEDVISDMVLDRTRIPDGVHMFRLAEPGSVIVITDKVLGAMRGKGLKGVALIKAETL